VHAPMQVAVLRCAVKGGRTHLLPTVDELREWVGVSG
jgi:hypothetical protein